VILKLFVVSVSGAMMLPNRSVSLNVTW
jgi:hypothetical protein